ncbi:MAG: M48 family metallopeptidase [Capsulimonadales bacterium]|nr:M48 family metallopeptidase [Capsulimonadales bacterium]
MNPDTYRWESLILRLDREARDRPGLYRFRVSLLAALPGIYLLILLLGAFAILGGLGFLVYLILRNLHGLTALKLLIPVCLGVLAFIGTLISALVIRVPEPEGIEVTYEEAVPLYLEIDRLREKLRVPRFHRIFLTDEFNCSVLQRPRFGIFGGHRSYLVIGLPLMASLSPAQFRAVLAHEMGHIAGGHSRFGARIRRIYYSYISLLAALDEEDRASLFLFAGFFSWFVPLFAAYTFVARRQNEYEADKLSAQAVGADTTAAALIATKLADVAIANGHTGPIDRLTAQRWLNALLSVRTDSEVVHPCLADRLRALDRKPTLPEPMKESALTHLFRHKAPMLLQRVGCPVVFTDEEPAASPASATRATITTPPSNRPATGLRPVGQ